MIPLSNGLGFSSNKICPKTTIGPKFRSGLQGPFQAPFIYDCNKYNGRRNFEGIGIQTRELSPILATSTAPPPLPEFPTVGTKPGMNLSCLNIYPEK